jgi:hypothetical protein
MSGFRGWLYDTLASEIASAAASIRSRCSSFSISFAWKLRDSVGGSPNPSRHRTDRVNITSALGNESDHILEGTVEEAQCSVESCNARIRRCDSVSKLAAHVACGGKSAVLKPPARKFDSTMKRLGIAVDSNLMHNLGWATPTQWFQSRDSDQHCPFNPKGICVGDTGNTTGCGRQFCRPIAVE